MFILILLGSWSAHCDRALSKQHVVLETLRGGLHQDYASVVFEFDSEVQYELPVMLEKEIFIRLKNVTTEVTPFRHYKAFDSWVSVQPTGSDMEVRIGFPKIFDNIKHFRMENPPRLVVNLYKKKVSPPVQQENSEPSDNKKDLSLGTVYPVSAGAFFVEKVTDSKDSANKSKKVKAEVKEVEAETKKVKAETKKRSSPKPVKAKKKIVNHITGDGLVTLNFHEVDVRELLSGLAIKRRINIIMTEEVSGNVSLHLYGASLDEAFDAITMAAGLDYSKRGNGYFIYKPKNDVDPELEKLQMRLYELKYAEVDKIQEALDVLPAKHVVKFHEPSKTVIVEDTPENIKKIETIIHFWDRKPRQVVIEAKILSVDLTDSMAFGVNWEKILGTARIGTGGFSTAVDAAAQSTSPIPSGGTGVFGNLISAAGTAHEFKLAMDALQTETKVNLLSTPRLLAIHGKNARVQVGGKQGYKETTVTSTGVSTETIKFLDEGVILDITPYVDENGNVLLNVKSRGCLARH